MSSRFLSTFYFSSVTFKLVTPTSSVTFSPFATRLCACGMTLGMPSEMAGRPRLGLHSAVHAPPRSDRRCASRRLPTPADAWRRLLKARAARLTFSARRVLSGRRKSHMVMLGPAATIRALHGRKDLQDSSSRTLVPGPEFQDPRSRTLVSGLYFQDPSFRAQVLGLEFQNSSSGTRVPGLESHDSNVRTRVSGLEFQYCSSRTTDPGLDFQG